MGDSSRDLSNPSGKTAVNRPDPTSSTPGARGEFLQELRARLKASRNSVENQFCKSPNARVKAFRKSPIATRRLLVEPTGWPVRRRRPLVVEDLDAARGTPNEREARRLPVLVVFREGTDPLGAVVVENPHDGSDGID